MRSLNIHNLTRLLNKLCLQLDEKYLINDGGCCFVSYLIAYHLDKLQLKYKLIIFSDEIKNSISISSEVYSKSKNKSKLKSVAGSYVCNHYTLYLEGGGPINISGFNKLPYKYYIEDINSSNIKWIYNSGIWNKIYNINYNNIIRKIIKEFFNNYKQKVLYEKRKH